jgi:hypothetical protein
MIFEAFLKSLIAPLLALLVMTIAAIYVVAISLSGIAGNERKVYTTPDGRELRPVVLDNPHSINKKDNQ